MKSEAIPSNRENSPLLEVDNLTVTYDAPGTDTKIRAVDGVSLAVGGTESVGLVGESGCGKTSIGNAIVGLVPVAGGAIRFRGTDIGHLSRSARRPFSSRIQVVFQDPFASLNPRLSVGSCIAEALKAHGKGETGAVRKGRVAELLQSVGLAPELAGRYPHEMSGGQRQRIGIARALAVHPSLIIADEPVSALDVSVQVQILNLLKDLGERMQLAYLFIAHDLAVVRYMCERVIVMYRGKVVETAPTDELYGSVAHPYTEALLSAVPDVDRALRLGRRGGGRIVLRGDVPSAAEHIPGCPFHPRCHRAQAVCRADFPPVVHLSPTHWSVCHFAEDVAAKKGIVA